MSTNHEPHRCQCTASGQCARNADTASLVTEYVRVPGLYRRWEIEQVIDEGYEFRVERHGADADGTALFAVYRRPTAE